jgi:cytidine deaminase
MSTDERELVEAARQVQSRAYAPYSGFKVGAALRGASGRVYTGCNVENASYGATVCAERGAIAQMVAAGEERLSAVVVYTEADEPAMPCGICRQALMEFADGDVPVVAVGPSSERRSTLAELLPAPFRFHR